MAGGNGRDKAWIIWKNYNFLVTCCPIFLSLKKRIMSKNIAKSPEMVQKEQEIKFLVSEIKKARTTLKRLTTRLDNSKEDFTSFQIKVQSELLSKMEKVTAVIQEIVEYAKKLSSAKFLSPLDKIALKEMISMFSGESVFGKEFDDFQEKKKKKESGDFDFDFEENARAKAKDIFKEFTVAPPKEEQRKIREVFIGLSSKFHPDKAKNDKEREDFHVLMQQINTAYSNNDIDQLLEMERLYVHSEAIDFSGKAVTIDVLTQETTRLKRELDFILNQVERIKEETKKFRASDIGKTLTSKNKAEREGEGIDAEVAQIESMLQDMTIMRNALKESFDKQELSASFYKIINGIGGEPEEEDFDLFGSFLDEDDDDSDFILKKMFSTSYEKPIKNPKFKVGQTVEVAKNIIHECSPSTNMKGWVGRVLEAISEEGEEVYYIHFDQKTIEGMTDQYIKDCIEEIEEFSSYGFAKEELVKNTSKRKFSQRDLDTLVNKRYNDNAWLHFPANIRKIIIAALTLDSQRSEGENWLHYLDANIPFPFDAKIRGLLRGYKKGEAWKVLKPEGENFDVGMIITGVTKKYEIENHPLVNLVMVNGTAKQRLILEAYSTWAQEFYMDIV